MPAGNPLGYLIPRKIPMIDPNTGLPIDEPVITSLLTPEPAPAQTNVMQSAAPENLLRGTPYSDIPTGEVNSAVPARELPAAPQTNVMQQQQAPQRERRSLLDTIGRISDVIARVGGAEAMYQPTLDAAQDRLRQIDLQELQMQQARQQVEAGQGQIEDTERARIGQALGAIAGNPDAAALWPQVAQEAGVDPQRAEAIGAIIQQNPQAAEIFARSLGWTPAAAPSMAKELQIYGLLRQESPDAANAYLQSLANPDALSPYQKAQLDISLAGLGLREREFVSDEARADREFEFKMEKETAKAGGGSEVAQILDDFGIKLTGPEDPVADMIEASTSGYAENIASMVPGAFGIATPGQVNIGRLETIDNAIVLALAGGKLGAGVSNADRDFFKAMSGKISDPNIPANQRIAAWSQIKQRLRGIQQRAKAPTKRKTVPRAETPAPRSRRSVSPVAAEMRRRGLIQ